MFLNQGILLCLGLQLVQSFHIYVTNTENVPPNTTCQEKGVVLYPCERLRDVADKVELGSFYMANISITLLPGNYYIRDSFRIRFNSMREVHVSSWKSLGLVRIICDGGDFSLEYGGINVISINSVEFYHCGNVAPTIFIGDVGKVDIQNANFTNSSKGFVKINGILNNVSISRCVFQGGTKTVGLRMTSDTVYISNTTFKNNTSGSLILYPQIYASNITLVIDRSVFANNKAGNKSRGAAIVMEGYVHSSRVNINAAIRRCIFVNNTADNGGAIIITDYDHGISIKDSEFINNTACNNGGAILFEGTSYKNKYAAFVENCTFIHNYAQNGGAIYILLVPFSHTLHSIASSKFSDNSATENGGALMTVEKSTGYNYVFESTNVILMENNTLDGNFAMYGGALHLSSVTNITLFNCSLTNNFASLFHQLSNSSKGGAAVIEQYSSSTMSIYITVFTNNSADVGGAIWLNGSHGNTVRITNSSFHNNTAARLGGSIYSYGYTIGVDHTIFCDNEATLGGALYLFNAAVNLSYGIYMKNKACAGGAIYSEKSYLYLRAVHLIANKALSAGINSSLLTTKETNELHHHDGYTMSSGKGGAIFMEDRILDCLLNSCRLTWDHLFISSNSAEFGSVLYGGMINRCDRITSTQIVSLNSSIEGHSHSAVSSDGIQFCFYSGIHIDCNIRSENITIYLGQSFEVHVACLDQVMQGKDCVITSQYIKTPGVKYGIEEHIRVIKGQKKLAFHAYSDNEEPFGLLTMKSNIMCIEEKWSSLDVNVSIMACPLGFEKTGAQCGCDNRLLQIFKTLECLIGNVTIMISEDGWFGYDKKYLRILNNCPLHYCSLTMSVNLDSYPHVQCNNNRGGILCSSCISKYSLVLGSWKCKNCSGLSNYNFIWMTILLALAGVLLVVFLILLNITVSSGTLNGLILYANILSVSGLLDHRNCSINPFLRAFISWINLDLGIEVCFYSGMDVYQKTWLQFVFPFYIWFLVGVIIVVCHYSITATKLMGRKSIEVLATLFLLSYGKFLKVIVSTFSFTDIAVTSARNLSDTLGTEKVWLYDAHLAYLGPKHWPLFTFALLCLVFLFLPYTMLLLFGQCLPYVPSRKGLRWIHSPKLSTIHNTGCLLCSIQQALSLLDRPGSLTSLCFFHSICYQ